jgi:hypothetical protein
MALNYSNYNVGSGGSGGDKTPLPVGKYISNPKPKDKAEVAGAGLTVAKYLGGKALDVTVTDSEGSRKKVPGPVTRHTFLIASDHVKGTAFLKIDVQDYFLTDAACALAFGKKPKDGGPFWVDPADAAELDPTVLTATQAMIESEAAEKVANANTPDEAVADSVNETIHKILQQIQINVGTIFRLQDWAGLARDPQGDLGQLEGTEFEGAVKASNLPDGAPEVSVWSVPKVKPVSAKQKSTDFQTA